MTAAVFNPYVPQDVGAPVSPQAPTAAEPTAIVGSAATRPAPIPETWLEALKGGDPRFNTASRLACSFCRAMRNHSPAVHLEQLEIAAKEHGL